jgi:phosphoadenosine phosphosulfate reductase
MITILSEAIQDKNVVEQLRYLAEKFKGKIAFSTSFGQEDQVITDLIFAHDLPIEVFTLDTGRMFEETYQVWHETQKKYGKKITAFYPDTSQVEKMVGDKGIYSFYDSLENRKECCDIRKVFPLQRALLHVDLWITGLRAEQSVTRTNVHALEESKVFNCFKFNPLLNWKLEEVLTYLSEQAVPYNTLHDKGFISIGCAPCTRAILPGEDIRAGRWWWESKDKKECGLHVEPQKPILNIGKIQ